MHPYRLLLRTTIAIWIVGFLYQIIDQLSGTEINDFQWGWITGKGLLIAGALILGRYVDQKLIIRYGK